MTWSLQVAQELRKEGAQVQKVKDVLFKDTDLLGTSTSVFEELSPLGQQILAMAAENSMDALMGIVAGSAGSGADGLGPSLGTALAEVQEANETVKGSLRQFLLESNAFNRPEVLDHLASLQGGAAVALGLDEDAKLRARNMNKRVSDPSPPRKCKLL